MTSQSNIRIGTRGSALAMTQAHGIAAKLLALGHDTHIEIIRTTGDADQVRPFAQVGAPGLFVREIERALIEERIDVAVHCYKDLPSDTPKELCIAAIPERDDPRDRLLIAPEAHAREAPGLPVVLGARIGTASARRQALLRHLRPDLESVHLRGNVPTRVEKVHTPDYDAVLLASAGLERLDRAAAAGECDPIARGELVEVDLAPDVFVPAPSQGALALQVRVADEARREHIGALDQAHLRACIRAERELLAMVDAGCQVPFGAYCTETDGRFDLHACLEVDGLLRQIHEQGHDPSAMARTAFAALLPERCES